MYEVKFVFPISNEQKYDDFFVNGPKFTFYLPNGIEDGIKIPLSKFNGTIQLWFDRHGVKEDNFIKYKKENINELIEDDILAQGVLDAGNLKGKLVIDENLDENLINIIKNGTKNNDEYMKLGKVIVKEIMLHVVPLVNTLKYKFGQYWLSDPELWNSKVYPLGVFCHYHLNIIISLNGNDWIDFIPDNKSQILTMNSIIREEFPEYLTKDDWKNIKNEILGGKRNNFSINKVLIKAYEYFVDEDINSAIISACTALELAIDKYYDSFSGNIEILKHFQKYNDHTSLRAKVIVILTPDNIEQIELLLTYIDKRNTIIHDGITIEKDEKKNFKKFLEIISEYFLKDKMKFPDHNHGNTSRNPIRKIT